MPDAPLVGAPAQASAADFLMASKKSEILDLEGFLRMGRVVVAISNLVHMLQRERGASNLYLGAAGKRYGNRLEGALTDTDQQMLKFQGALAELDPTSGIGPGESRLLSRIAYTVHLLSEISVLRSQVRTLALTPERAIDAYSELVRGLLAVVFEAADIAMDPTLSRTLVAMFNFMQGKELAGQERAAGAAGFVMGRFEPAAIERMTHLQESQARCFDLFAEFTDAPTLRAWEALKQSADQTELERLRRLIGETTVDTLLADRWFVLATARIDAMKQVEDRLEQRLHQLCEEKLQEAREGLKTHQVAIEELLKQEDQASDSFVVFCNTSSAPGAAEDHPDDLNGRVGRSVIELVQYQSQRLQQMNDELNAARAALEERKLLDRAKALLMKHRRMTEEEAYRLLRQTAMNQSRRLVDVARAMVAVGEVWARPDAKD